MFGLFFVRIFTLLACCYGFSDLWTCKNGFCKKTYFPQGERLYDSFELCELVCNSYLNIWPQPTGTVNSLKELVYINSRNITFHYDGPESAKSFLYQNLNNFIGTLEDSIGCPKVSYPMEISMSTSGVDLDLNLDTDESYEMKVEFTGTKISVVLSGGSVYGVRHGVETLFQLIIPSNSNGNYCISTASYVNLTDKPAYRHRGLLIDTARNFLSIDKIKRNIDGMASCKMNVLHWHITDSQSFPLEISRLPNMTKYGAYDAKKIYTRKDITDLISYAKLRGVRILLEIDGPSHAGNGWQWGPDAGLGNLAVCINKQPWRSYCIQPPCGQLNPVNPNLYKIAEEIFKEITEIFPDTGVFHMGGDEVFLPCWNSSVDILNFLKGKPLTQETYLNLWAAYQNKMTTAFDNAIGHDKTSVILWTSHLTQPEIIEKYIPKDRYIIQAWLTEANKSTIHSLVNLGYKLIISTKDKWYFDHGFWGTTSYYNWQKVYNNVIYPYKSDQILGGEVCMWGELVDDNNVEQRIWPRAAAAAERLWSNPRTSSKLARYRFYAHRERLIQKGLQPAAEIPRWCMQNPGECETYL